MGDSIKRQDAIDAIERRLAEPEYQHSGEDWYVGMNCAESEIYDLPSVQPDDPAIPLSWIEEHIEWLKSLDNEFANLTAMQISTMVKKWKGEQGG